MIATAGDTALIVVAAVWGVLVLFLCFVLRDTSRVLESTKLTIDAMREETVPLLRDTSRVLESTKLTIDAMREETVPLLREVKSSIERTNREIDRIDVVLESAGAIVGRVERFSGLVEEAATSPL